MELDWPAILRSVLVFGVPALIIALWATHRRKAQKENERISEILRKKTK